MLCRFVALVFAFGIMPSAAFAYVDPGILGMLYQTLYVLVFGVLATWVFKPWQYIRKLFRRSDEPKFPPESSEKAQTNKEASG